jgi:ectoine hydroxylase-related dioxygenase (phytanoyl-CoA dioxygenase family)
MTRPPLPPQRFDVELSDAQVAFFREHGYLALERITTDEEVAWLGAVYDRLFAANSGQFDVTRPYGSRDTHQLSQLLFPEQRVPELRETNYYRNARRAIARLLGAPETALEAWGHMLRKPPNGGHSTPWHQDEAYWEPDFDYCAAGAWLPLEDVDMRNGCMCFLPGSQAGPVLAHHHYGGDPAVHLLEVDELPDESRAMPVPLRVGGATFHHPRTLHATAPNSTDRPRRAWANEFQLPPQRRATRAHRPWVDEGKRALAEVLRAAPRER